jgi:glyoxylase-like metal-dependent hydrolase (beta-lactamase superfamily II)
MKITSSIHQIKIPIPNNPLEHINSYIIEGRDGWVMIDSGWYTEEAFQVLLKSLMNLGLTPKDISTIIITHIHPDHFGLAGKIKKLNPNIKIAMHQWESSMIEARYARVLDLKDKMTLMLQSHGVPPVDSAMLESAYLPNLDSIIVAFPDLILYGGEIIGTGIYDLEVVWTPGHSPGHICLFEPENGFLFSGDHILPSITPNVSFNIQSGDNPLGSYLYALNKLRNLPVVKVFPGHEEPFTNIRDRIDQIFKHHDQRKLEVQRAIADEPHNAWEISSQITWNTPVEWEELSPLPMRSAVTETIAHLELLRCEGKVRRIHKGVSIFYATNF